MSEYDALDAMVERMARDEQEDINREQGQLLLDLMTARGDKDPFIELLNQAQQARMAQEDDKQ